MDTAVVEQVLKGAIPALIFALAILGLWRSPPEGKSRSEAALVPLVMWLIAAVTWAVALKLAVPPTDSFSRLPLVYLGLAIGAGACAIRMPAAVGAVAATIGAAIAAYFTLPAAAEHVMPQLLLFAGAALPIALLKTDGLATTTPRAASVAATVITGGAAMLLLIAFSSLKLAQAAGIFACMSTAATVLVLCKRPVPLGAMHLFLAACALVTMFQGQAVTGVARPWAYIYCVGWAPLIGLAARAACRKVPRWQAAAYVGGVVLSVVIALGIAFATMTSSEY